MRKKRMFKSYFDKTKEIEKGLTLTEAEKIVNVWGTHLEHMGVIRIIFGAGIPISTLPYPKEILYEAINKMKDYYQNKGMEDRVNLLDETAMLLILYVDDTKALQNSIELFRNEDWLKNVVHSIVDYQKTQLANGYLVDRKLFTISKKRLEELSIKISDSEQE